MLSPVEFAIISSTVAVCFAAALWWSCVASPGHKPANTQDHTPFDLFFRDGMLHHASDEARFMYALEPGTHFWDDLRDKLLTRFPDFPVVPGTGPHGRATVHASDGNGPDQAEIAWRGSACWVSLRAHSTTPANLLDADLKAELQDLRRMRESAPNPAWQEDQSGRISWYNKSYETLYNRVHGGPVDPGKPLFSDGDDRYPNRVSIKSDTDGQPDWYQLATVPAGRVNIFHATCINAIAEAENAQRSFVQTLAKTFAHLSIGLAIFDRNGQLAIFNPALVDLTKLPAHYLSARPTMLSFFDQLRENRTMPEPKNYHDWREEIAGVIAAATDGRYQETWSLESGQTYNVKGRPYPDGATAFLIEDISAEMTLTRNFRAELEQGQLLLDTVDEAMAVFSPTGVLTFSNAAYRDMWDVDPDASFADVLIRDSVAIWKERFGASRVWKSIEEFVSEFGDRKTWNIEVGQVDGANLSCHIVPLASGSTLIQFRQKAVVLEPEIKRRRMIAG